MPADPRPPGCNAYPELLLGEFNHSDSSWCPVHDGGSKAAVPAQFYILSLKWSQGDMLTWWRPNSSGYTWFLHEAGVYSEVEARARSWEREAIAVPVAQANALAVQVIGGSKRAQVLEAAAAAGFVLSPEPPPVKPARKRCVGCAKFVDRYVDFCLDCIIKQVTR